MVASVTIQLIIMHANVQPVTNLMIVRLTLTNALPLNV